MGLIDDYFAAQDPYDAERLARFRHPDWSADWPQSGERIPSHEADRQIHENYPGYPAHEVGRVARREERWALSPSMTPVRVTGSGNLFTAEVRLEYPGEDRWLSAGVGELRDGLIHRERVYYCRPYPAEEWRARWVEPIPEGDTSPLDVGDGDEREHRERLEQFFETVMSSGWAEAIPLLWHDDAVVDYPQSRERTRGIENIIAVPTNHPSSPTPRDHRVTGDGDLFVLENDLDYGGVRWLELAIFAFRGEKVARSVHYYAEPFEPPQWRARWVERIER